MYLLLLLVIVSKDGTTLLANFQGDQIYTFDILHHSTSASVNTACHMTPTQSRSSQALSHLHNYDNDEDSDDECRSETSSHMSTTSYNDEKKDSDNSHPHRHHFSFTEPHQDSMLYKSDYKHDTEKIVGAKACYGGHFNYATFLKSVSFFGPSDEYIVAGCDSGRMWIWETASGYIQDRNMTMNMTAVSPNATTASTSTSTSLIHNNNTNNDDVHNNNTGKYNNN